MRHLGDITKINGAEVPVVDAVIGGSPCQDLSIAGKRAGLAGARSGLYMEQIRVIKEMRERDRRMGRTGEFIRPRYMVWENVPGAFSSNGGKDFAAVLEEVIRIAEPEAPDIEVPEKGWNTWGGYHDEVGGRWSVAWRVHDAQHWGVPQRRRRIALVADFGGDTAGEISFERKSVPGDITQSRAAGKGTTGAAENGADCAIPINDKATRYAGGGPTRNHDGAGNGLGVGKNGDPAPTLTAGDRHSVCAGFKLGNSEKARSIGYAEEQAPTLNAECGGNKPAVMCLNDQGGSMMGISYDVSGTLRAQEHGHQPSILDMSHACDVIRDCGEVAPSLQARMGTGGNQIPLTYAPEIAHSLRAQGNDPCREDAATYLVQNMVVRRLTPLECERLQGYPDGWTDIGEWVDSRGKRHKEADSPRYKALGNSIALPPWKWLLKRICAQYTRNATMASLFDGIGGFPLIWEQLNGRGTCLWASEIEEFPMAVTRRRFGDPETGEMGDMGRFLFPCGKGGETT